MKASKASNHGLTLIEIVVAGAILAIVAIVTTQAMLTLNRDSSLARVQNLAKAAVLGRIQEVSAENYDPTATPAVVPTNLRTGTTTTAISLGDSSTELGAVPATLIWTVASAGPSSILSIKCRANYTYLGRNRFYEVSTYRAPN